MGGAPVCDGLGSADANANEDNGGAVIESVVGDGGVGGDFTGGKRRTTMALAAENREGWYGGYRTGRRDGGWRPLWC